MVRTKERHLLVAVDDLGAEASVAATAPSADPAIRAPSVSIQSLSLSDVHQSIRDAVHRHVSGLSGNLADGHTAAASVQTKHYSPEARLVMVRVPLAHSRPVRDAIGLVKLSRQRSVKMSVVRAFGNAMIARRALARQLEMVRRQSTDDRAQKRLRQVLEALDELQRR